MRKLMNIAIVSVVVGLLALPASLQQNAVITNIETTNVLDSSATVTWQTIVEATSWVEYGATEAYGQTKGDAAMGVNHSIVIPNLLPNQEYHYRVKSADTLGNTMTSSDKRFTTSRGSLDTGTPSTINDLKVVDRGFNTVTIEWTATGDDGIFGTATRYDIRRAESRILLRSTTWFANIEVSGAPQPLLSGTKQRIVIGNLPISETMVFAIRVIDEANNISDVSNIVEATTEPLSFGAFPITQVKILNPSSNGVILQWFTAVPATTELLLGKTTEYEIPVQADTRKGNAHSMVLGGLESGTTYHFKIQAMEEYGSTATTGDITFTTL